MKQYKSLDLAKCICALWIIILHTAPFASYSSALTFGFRNIITVIAVPFFFMTSGFLAFKKMESLTKEEKREYIIHYLKRLAIMYVIWSAVYFVFVVIKWTRSDFSIWSVLEYVKDFFFEGSYSTIWFLPALFTAKLLVYLLHKKWNLKTIFLISCVVYVFTLGGSSYYGLASKIPFIKGIYNIYYSFFDSIKNGVCFGLIFVSMGAMMTERETEVLSKTSNTKALILLIVFGGLFAVEEFVIAYFNWNIRGVDTVAFLVPFAWFLFVFLLKCELNISNKACMAFRKYSILMFLCQRIPLSIIDLFLEDTILATNSLLYFATVLSATLFISFLIIQLSKRFKLIKYAY